MLQFQLGAHWLAFLWSVAAGEKSKLVDAVAKARSAGASAFELIYHILNGLTAEQTAAALKEGGITKAVMCVFFPQGDDGSTPMGDPLSNNQAEVRKAVTTFRQVLAFIQELRGEGIEINLVVGPSFCVLGKDYGISQPDLNERIITFYRVLGPDIRRSKVKVAIELLRKEEDLVIQEIGNAKELLTLLNQQIEGDVFGFHYDTFHIHARGYNQALSIMVLGKLILHLHVNGSGRLPAGHVDDEVDWQPILDALEKVGVSGLIATNEPFCALVRQECQPLGIGLPPPVDEPGGIIQTRAGLETYNVQFIE